MRIAATAAASALLFCASAAYADCVQIVRAKQFSSVAIKSDTGVPPVSAVRFVPKHNALLSASENLVCLWDAKTLARKKRFYSEAFGKLNAVCADADGRFAYAAGGAPGKSGGVFKINLDTGETRTVLEAADEFYATAFDPEAKLLAAGALNGELAVVNAESGETLFRSPPDGSKVVALEFSPKGAYLAAAYADGRIVARAAEDSFKTPAASLNARGVPVAMKFMPGREKDIAIASGFGTDAKITTFRAFSERTRREIATPGANAAAFYVRGIGYPFVLAGKSGALTAYKNAQNADPMCYESVNMRFECADRGAINNVVAAGSGGRIILWQNYNGLLVGGIVIQDPKGEDYAVWTVQGNAHSTRENSVEFLDSKGGRPENARNFLSRERAEKFLEGKNSQKKASPKPKGKA